MSEESCEYGVHGVAYFIADASKVIDGDQHHDLGTTRIYTSHDAGRTWKPSIATGWTDDSVSVVDTAPGPNQNRLYVYFNGLNGFYHSIGQIGAAKTELEKTSSGTRVGMISYKDGDAQVAGPFTSAEMAKEKYPGSYPGTALLLKDGSLLTIYTTHTRIRRPDEDEWEYVVEAVRTSADRSSLEAPVKLVARTENSKVDCGGNTYDHAATYDAQHDSIYFVYSSVRDRSCQLFLTVSTDGGRSWSKAQQVHSPDNAPERAYGSPAIAFNKEGVVAVIWEEKLRSGCWMFAALSDDGRSLSNAQQLGMCGGASSKPSALSNAYLWNTIRQTNANDPASSAEIYLRNAQGSVWRNKDAIAVTPDGAFHPVWIDAGNGEGEIRTAAIHVIPAESLISTATAGLREVTNKIAILYGGYQSYDVRSKTLTLDIVIKNNSANPIGGPFKLVVPNHSMQSEFTEIANADNGVTGEGAIWDIDSSILGGTLGAGGSSKPFVLKFRYLQDEDTPHSLNDVILDLQVRVYAGM